MRAYVALIHLPEDGSSWGGVVPDVPGCVSAGDTFEEAVENAREALSGHPIPEARSYKQMLDDEEAMAAVRAGAAMHLVMPRELAEEGCG